MIKWNGCGTKTDTWIKRTESKMQKRIAVTFIQLILDKSVKSIHWRKDISLTNGAKKSTHPHLEKENYISSPVLKLTQNGSKTRQKIRNMAWCCLPILPSLPWAADLRGLSSLCVGLSHEVGQSVTAAWCLAETKDRASSELASNCSF